MRKNGTVKVGSAFLAGIVVAVLGTFLYLRAVNSSVQDTPYVVESVSEPAVTSNAVTASETKPSPAEAPLATSAKAKPQMPPASQQKSRLRSQAATTKVGRVTRPSGLPILAESTLHSISIPDVVVSAPPSIGQAAAARQPAEEVLPPQPHTVTLPAGVHLTVRLQEELSTDHNFPGDTFRATLQTPIIANGFIIADHGAKVLGRIAEARKPSERKGLAELSLTLTQVSTTDGQQMTVETNYSLRKGASNTNQEVITIAGGTALGAAIGALAGGGKGAVIGAGAGGAAGTGAALLSRNKPAVIESETPLTFELTNPVTITEKFH